jgi:hypothetical protein
MNKKLPQREIRASAEQLAIECLSFIACEPERLSAFLGQTGLDPGNLRSAAASPGFLAGVLDHVASDEQLLLAFAAETGRDPATIGRARAALGGAPPEWSP